MPASVRLAAIYFAYFAYVGVSAPYFPLYLAARGFHAAEIAFVLALGPLARIFAPTFWGWLADRTGARRGIVIFSCAAIACGFAVLPFAEGIVAVAALMALMNVLSAGAMPLVETITLSSLAAPTLSGKRPGTPVSPVGGYGRVRLWGSVGFIGAVLATGAWLDFRPAGTLAALLAAIAGVTFAVSFMLPRGSVHRTATDDGAAAPQDFPGPPVRALLGAGFCMALAHGALYAFFSLHLERIGHAASAIGALWTIGVLAEIGVFLFLPLLFRRFSLASILLASFLAAALRFVAIGWGSDSLIILVLAQLLHGLTFGAHHAASVAAVHRLFPDRAHARGQALFSSVSYGAGGAAGALIAGWVWETAGPGPMFSFAALAALVGAGLALRLRRSRL